MTCPVFFFELSAGTGPLRHAIKPRFDVAQMDIKRLAYGVAKGQHAIQEYVSKADVLAANKRSIVLHLSVQPCQLVPSDAL